MQQCEEIKSEVQSLSDKFDSELSKLDPQSPDLLTLAARSLKHFLKNIGEIYRNKYGLKVLLVVDQINAIVADYRKAQIKLMKAHKEA